VIICGFDTETDWNVECSKTWIAQWCLYTPDGPICGYGDEKNMYQTQQNVLNTILDLSKGVNNVIVAVHNLNFDGRFLLNAIEMFDAVYNKDFSYSLIYRNSKIISIRMKYKKAEINWHDTSVLHPGTSVASLGKLIGLPKLDGPGFFPGWSKQYDNLEYVKRDAEIVRNVRTMDYAEGMTQATASSYAWYQLKGVVNANDSRTFKQLFPELPADQDMLSRMCYVGGFNFSDNQGYHEGPIYHADIVSSYPHKYRDAPLPYGLPGVTHTMPEVGYWESVFWARLELKKDKVPWYTPKRVSDIMKENVAREDAGLPEIELGVGVENTITAIPLTVNSIDWETLNDNYYLHDLRESGLYLCYKTRAGVLEEYADLKGAEKIAIAEQLKEDPDNGVLKTRYNQVKYSLNMPSGRFGLRRENEEAYIYEGKIETKPGEEITDSYVPFISAICAHGRKQVIDALNTVPPHLRYHVDTDSVIAGTLPDVEYGKELGQWSLEVYKGLYEGGMKKYIEVNDDDSLKVTCAGVPKGTHHGVPVRMWVELIDDPNMILEQEKVTELGHLEYKIKSEWLRDEYKKVGLDPDKVNTLKLLPKRVEGGVILMPSSYDLHKGTGFVTKIRGRKLPSLKRVRVTNVREMKEKMKHNDRT